MVIEPLVFGRLFIQDPGDDQDLEFLSRGQLGSASAALGLPDLPHRIDSFDSFPALVTDVDVFLDFIELMLADNTTHRVPFSQEVAEVLARRDWLE